jgi:hypothetical protein
MAAKQAKKPREKKTDVSVKLAGIIARLEKEALRRVSRRQSIEDRWIEDYRQYHGEYDPDLLKDLDDQDKSTLFINETRPKTVSCAARLFDMLFPTDDRNWGIKPTPVPQLATEAMEGLAVAQQAEKKANAAVKAGDPAAAEAIAQEANAIAESAEMAEAEMSAAGKAAKEMELEIEDQLKECNYAAECREVIEDMCIFGAGVMEGPVANDRVQQVWRAVELKDDEGKIVLENGKPVMVDELVSVSDPRPAARRVDFWGVFGEPDAMKAEDSADWYVRRLKSPQKMRHLARQPGFDADAIRELLEEGPKKGDMPSYLEDLRNIGKTDETGTDDKFVVWEYRGQLTADDLIDVCECLGVKTKDEKRKRHLDAISKDAEEGDLLKEINVVLWFCQGKCLKFGIHHLDRGEHIYSVVPLERDAASMWGLGIPALMRDPQSALNGAWRMMMDNGGLSSGPMIALNRKYMNPVDNSDDLYARKLYDIHPDTPDGVKLFDQIQITANQEQYAGIIEIARAFIDTMSGQPMIAQGEQPTSVTKTLGGMAMLMNSANVLIRRIVRNFDDRLTTPMIRRFYDWNMQFNKKRSIKGDQTIEARGSSVLLVKELQSQNVMAFALNFGGHPIYGRFIKEYELLQEVANTNMIPRDRVIKTEQEVKAEEAKAAEQEPPKTPEEIKGEQALVLEDKRHANRMEELAFEQDTQMMKMATEQNVKLADIDAWLKDRREDRASKERLFVSEAAIERQNAGAGPSGGYLSAPPKPGQSGPEKKPKPAKVA